MVSVGSGSTTPSATNDRRLSLASMMPQPVCRRPGSMPRIRMTAPLTRRGALAPVRSIRSAVEAGHDLIGHFVVGRHALDVVVVLERVDQLHELWSFVAADIHGHGGTPIE